VSGPAFATNAWHFVSVVMDSSTRRVQFYRDGLALAHKNYSGSFYPAPLPGLTIGGDPADPHLGQGFWDGSISDLALWTRALSPSELTSIYNAGLAGQPLLALVPEPSPISLSALAVVLIVSCATKTRRSKVLL
jgi:hypothetical protein